MTIMTSSTRERITEAAKDGEEAMWETVARAFPEAKHGDLDPLTTFNLSETIRNAVAEWVRTNMPPRMMWRNDTGDDVECSCGNEVNMEGFFPCDERGVTYEYARSERGVSLVKCARCDAIYHQPDGLRAGSIVIGERI